MSFNPILDCSPEIEEKTCKDCGLLKPLKDYYVHRERKGSDEVKYIYHSTFCKKCHMKRMKNVGYSKEG